MSAFGAMSILTPRKRRIVTHRRGDGVKDVPHLFLEHVLKNHVPSGEFVVAAQAASIHQFSLGSVFLPNLELPTEYNIVRLTKLCQQQFFTTNKGNRLLFMCLTLGYNIDES